MKRSVCRVVLGFFALMLVWAMPGAAATYSYVGQNYDPGNLFPRTAGAGYITASVDMHNCVGPCAEGAYIEGIDFTYFTIGFVSTPILDIAPSYSFSSTHPGYNNYGLQNFLTFNGVGEVVSWFLFFSDGQQPFGGVFTHTSGNVSGQPPNCTNCGSDMFYDDSRNITQWLNNGRPGQWSLEQPAVVPIPPALPFLATGLMVMGYLAWRFSTNSECQV